MNEETAERLRRIEAHVAHLEHQLEQVNDIVVEHDKLIARLRKEVQRQSNTLQSEELEQIKSRNLRPPHHQ
jgi:uncharacterized coiled-coil protein SlyX